MQTALRAREERRGPSGYCRCDARILRAAPPSAPRQKFAYTESSPMTRFGVPGLCSDRCDLADDRRRDGDRVANVVLREPFTLMSSCVAPFNQPGSIVAG